MKAFVVGTIFSGLGGGSDVNFEVLKTLPQLGIEVTLQVPTFYIHRAVLAYLQSSSKKNIQNPIERIMELESAGIEVLDYVKAEINRLIERYSQNVVDYTEITSVLFLFRAARRDKNILLRHNGSKKFDFVLAMNEIYPVFNCAMIAVSILNVSKSIVMLHTEPYRTRTHPKKVWNKPKFESFLKDLIIKRKWEKAFGKRFIIGITSPSAAPILISGLKDRLLQMKIPVYYPDPPWCLSSVFYNSRTTRGKDGLIFMSRLVEDKGIFELPEIVSKLSLKKITLIGEFTKDDDKDEFFHLASKYGITVNYLGFLTHKELAPILAKHKVLLYPSHADSYSITVAQAVLVGTSVVAYDIPAISLNYGKLRSVRIVPEGNTEAMSQEINEILQMEEEEFISTHENADELSFIDKFRNCKPIWKSYGQWIKLVWEKV